MSGRTANRLKRKAIRDVIGNATPLHTTNDKLKEVNDVYKRLKREYVNDRRNFVW